MDVLTKEELRARYPKGTELKRIGTSFLDFQDKSKSGRYVWVECPDGKRCFVSEPEWARMNAKPTEEK